MKKSKRVQSETITKALITDSRVIATENPEKIAEYYTTLVFVVAERNTRVVARSKLEELTSIMLISQNKGRRYVTFCILGDQYESENTTEYGEFLWKAYREFYSQVIEYCPGYKT